MSFSHKQIAQQKIGDIAIQIRAFRAAPHGLTATSHWRSVIFDFDGVIDLILGMSQSNPQLSGLSKELRQRWSRDPLFRYLGTYRDQDTHIRSRKAPQIASRTDAKVDLGPIVKIEGSGSLTIGRMVVDGVDYGSFRGEIVDGVADASVNTLAAAKLLTVSDAEVSLPPFVVTKKGDRVYLPDNVLAASYPARMVIDVVADFLADWSPKFGLTFSI